MLVEADMVAAADVSRFGYPWKEGLSYGEDRPSARHDKLLRFIQEGLRLGCRKIRVDRGCLGVTHSR